MKSKKIISFAPIFIICFLIVFFQIQLVFATPSLKDAFSNFDDAGVAAGYSQDSIFYLLSIIINTVISLLGVIFISLMVYGGYLWMTARGNEEQVEKAKKLITAAVIGVVIVLSAYAISYFVISNIGDAALQTTSPAP